MLAGVQGGNVTPPVLKNPELCSCGPLFEIVGRVVLSCSKKCIIQKTVENRIGSDGIRWHN